VRLVSHPFFFSIGQGEGLGLTLPPVVLLNSSAE
jgi:hypothetical protein